MPKQGTQLIPFKTSGKRFWPLAPVVEKNSIVHANKSIVIAITSMAIRPEMDEQDFRECQGEFSKLILKAPVIFKLLVKQRRVFLLPAINGDAVKRRIDSAHSAKWPAMPCSINDILVLVIGKYALETVTHFSSMSEYSNVSDITQVLGIFLCERMKSKHWRFSFASSSLRLLGWLS